MATLNPKLCSEALGVVLASLKFDFVGIFPDESTEDVGTIQVSYFDAKICKSI